VLPTTSHTRKGDGEVAQTVVLGFSLYVIERKMTIENGHPNGKRESLNGWHNSLLSLGVAMPNVAIPITQNNGRSDVGSSHSQL
jgi:hypothetical protein